MAEEQVGLNIDVLDLRALAEINPLAWEQLLHIADARILKTRISQLESDLDMALNPSGQITRGDVCDNGATGYDSVIGSLFGN